MSIASSNIYITIKGIWVIYGNMEKIETYETLKKNQKNQSAPSPPPPPPPSSLLVFGSQPFRKILFPAR